MTGRRSNTGAQPTPLEETEPTAPAQPAPQPVEQPPAEPLPPEPPADDAELSPAMERTVAAMITDALADVRRGPFGLIAAQQEDNPLTVGEAIAEVTRRIGAVEKTGTADARSGGYKFRGIDQVLAALHPILGDVGLVLMPGRIVEHRRETRATSGSPLNVAILRVRFRLIGPDGSTTTGEAWGEGGDTGDKGTQKAMSQAYKSFALQTFSIPTEQSADDEPDATNPPSRTFTQEEVDRATTAKEAAHGARSLEELVGIRRRAEHLLAVPVELGEGGGRAPLSVWFDRRRAALEQATGAGA